MEMREPEILRTVLITVIIIIVLLILWVSGIMKSEGIWLTYPLITIRISTVITAILCFSLVLFMQRKKPWKSLYYAGLAVIFPMGLYEFIWYNIAVVMKSLPLLLFPFAALLGWVFLGVREVYNIRPSNISLVLYGIFIATMMIWVFAGLNFNYLGNSSFTWTDEFLNVVSKGAITFGYAFHISEKN